MDCDRLEKLVKSWYLQVQDEALAPARMIDFMEEHISACEVCLADEAVKREVKRISDIVLPPAKVRKKSTEEEGAVKPETAAPVDPADDGHDDPDDDGHDDPDDDDPEVD